MNHSLRAVSLSHRTASVEIRERFALNEDTCKKALFQLKEFLNLPELLILSTCNRTEIYYAADEDLSQDIIKLTGIVKGISAIETYLPHFQLINDSKQATEHLFEVAMGLDSQVVGDIQIINQVKMAYQWSADMGLAGALLHRLLHTIFFTNKRVQQETKFRDGAASVSYATVELIELLAENLRNPKILVIGLGEIGTDVVRNMAARKFSNVTLTNRTFAKVAALAEEFGFETADFSDVYEKIAESDIIISSLAGNQPFISHDFLQGLHLVSHKYLIDLAVPRSIENTAENVNGVVLYNIDDIQQKANEALEKRIAAIPQVKAIIAEAIAGFGDWSQEMLVSPTINKLKNALEQIRQEEISRFVKSLSPQENEKVEQITKNIMQKIIKLPVLQLKAACKRGEAETLIDVLNDLFDLEKKSVS
ncbi:MAG: glutamyl-tRNA reductase [Verrucomicrobia bacterium]|nr:glutamyl-tRNA reductase [Cytophagales bacterium]